MTDNQYAFGQAAPGSPEPPLRAQVSAASSTSAASVPSSDQTESFAAARMGDTDTLPTVSTAVAGVNGGFTSQAQASFAQEPDIVTGLEGGFSADRASNAEILGASGYASEPSGYAADSFKPGPAYIGGATQAPTPASAAYDAAPAAYSAPDATAAAPTPSPSPAASSYAASVAAGTAAQSPTAVAAPAAQTSSAKQQKKSGGAGKTALVGFLSALLGCGVALGASNVLAASAPTPVVGGTAVIGTTDQSIINAAEEGQTLAEAVAAKALPSVVAIYNYQNQASYGGYGFGYGYGLGNQDEDSLVATGMGSGVVISDDGYIITNYHVVEDASKLTVSVDGVERDATYVGGDSSSDIAVIKVEDTEGLVTADIGDSDSLRIGEWVMTVGAPLGLEQSVATGVVSATNRSTIMDSSTSGGNDLYSYLYGNSAAPEYTYYPNMIQTDAVINPGNSGGALVDADGKLIGINAMISSYSGDYAGVGFAIPINYAISIAQTVIDGKEPTHAMIGVSLSQVNSTIAERYNLSADSGAYISAITPDTGAADSELAVGDIITKVDGKTVTSPTDVTLEVRAHKVGDTIKLTVNRDGETLDVEVTLTSDENMTASSSSSSQYHEEGQDEGQNEDPGRPDGNGRGDSGWGNGRSYDMEDIERLFELLGM